MTRAEKKHYQEISKKCQACLVASVGLVLALTLVKMVASNRAANWGKNLEATKTKTVSIQKQNLHLKRQLAQKTGGLSQLVEIAKKQGFNEKPTYQYFPSGVSVAQVLP